MFARTCNRFINAKNTNKVTLLFKTIILDPIFCEKNSSHNSVTLIRNFKHNIKWTPRTFLADSFTQTSLLHQAWHFFFRGKNSSHNSVTLIRNLKHDIKWTPHLFGGSVYSNFFASRRVIPFFSWKKFLS